MNIFTATLGTITLAMLLILAAMVMVIRDFSKRDKYANFKEIRAKESEARSHVKRDGKV
jgi:hypothetical protein